MLLGYNMRYVIIGLGNIGRKRRKALKEKCVGTIDPVGDADYKNFKEVSLDIYDAAIMAVPNEIKIEILEYLLSNGKHALIEKPLLFEDEKLAEKLDSIARYSGSIWYTSYNHRFEPLVVKLKKMLEVGLIGHVYFAKLMYGNGTVQNIVNTWRDRNFGVLGDLGCHLMDFASFLFPGQHEYKITGAHSFEANALDYCAFSTIDGHLQFLCSTLIWKNVLRIDVYGIKGSLHLDGLQKWGESRLTHHRRILPSGIPEETVFVSSGEDESWNYDIDHFEKMVSEGKTSYENDLNISRSINSLTSCLSR